jgi:hypothetical protein
MGLHLKPIDGQVERRKSARESVRLSAALLYGGNSVPCTVRDISATGAAVLVPEGGNVPDRVTLVIEGKPGRRSAEVKWRLAPLVALEFKDT